jgi:hypothetical protein
MIGEGKVVTLVNGTITVDADSYYKFNTLIHNNATLLNLSNVVLDGTYLDNKAQTGGRSYVVYNENGSCSIKGATRIITNTDGEGYAFNVANDNAVKVVDTAMINEISFKVANIPTLVQANVIDAAAYVLNYQSKAVFGFYATAEQAIDAATKYYTVVLMKDADCSGKTLEAVASITLKTNGFDFKYAEVKNIKVK